jgi:heterotetrameric sarcosine oxidase gamma subunit
VVSLVASSPFDHALPLTPGEIRLTEVPVEDAVLIAPFEGAEREVGAILQKSLGLLFPGPGETARSAEARILWAGPGRALLIGAALPEGLGDRAAITDQGDGIAALGISGQGVEAVLARLVPIDLRSRAFPVGRTARTLVGHMTAEHLVHLRLGDDEGRAEHDRLAQRAADQPVVGAGVGDALRHRERRRGRASWSPCPPPPRARP